MAGGLRGRRSAATEMLPSSDKATRLRSSLRSTETRYHVSPKRKHLPPAMKCGAPEPVRISLTMRKKPEPPRRGIQLAELFLPGEDHKIRLAAQIGITHAIVNVNRVLAGVPRDRYLEALRKIRADFEAAGLIFAGVE